MGEIRGKRRVTHQNLGEMGGYGPNFGENGWIWTKIWGKWVDMARILGKTGEIWGKTGVMNRNLGKMGGYGQNLGEMCENSGKTGVMNRNLDKMGGYGPKLG